MLCCKGGPEWDAAVVMWMAALRVPDIIARSSLGLMPYTYQTGAQLSASFAVSMCSNAAMGQHSRETAGLHSAGGIETKIARTLEQ